MKICIIAYSPRSIAPYLKKYIDILNNAGIDFDYITREIRNKRIDDVIDENQYVIEYDEVHNLISKAANVYKWRKQVENIVMRNRYDKLIVLTGYPAVILCGMLAHKYQNRFILDIRDYMPLFDYKTLMNRLKTTMNSAAFTTISSAGFRQWLPSQQNVYEVHNLPLKVTINNQNIFQGRKSTIRIGYLGVVSYYNENEAIIKALGNVPGYELEYSGLFSEPDRLQKFCAHNDIRNVIFNGPFLNEKKGELYSQIDLINSVYGNGSLVVTSALPNKLYDAIIYRKPIIVSRGTYLASVVEEYNLGVAIDLTSNIRYQLDTYLSRFNSTVFNEGAERYIKICQRADKKIINKICHLCQ